MFIRSKAKETREYLTISKTFVVSNVCIELTISILQERTIFKIKQKNYFRLHSLKSSTEGHST